MGDWDKINSSAETNQLIWDSETYLHSQKRDKVDQTKSGKEIKTRLKPNSRDGDWPQYENYAVEVNITQDGDSDGSRGEFAAGTYLARFFTVDSDQSGAGMGGAGGMGRVAPERDVEEGRLQVLTAGSADSGSSRRRASHEGTIRQTALPNPVDVAGL